MDQRKLWPLCPECQMPLAGAMYALPTRIIATCGFCDWAFDSKVSNADLTAVQPEAPTK